MTKEAKEVVSRPGRRGMGQGGIVYPWAKWLERMAAPRLRPFKLKHQKDFYCLPHSMEQLLRNAAKQHGYAVRVKILPDGIQASATKQKKRRSK